MSDFFEPDGDPEPVVVDLFGPTRAVTRCLADVAPEGVEWLWPGRIPARKLVLVEGPPGTGKSFAAYDLAARVSCGEAMPLEQRGRPPMGVLIVAPEDGIADTVRPRLEAARADLLRCHVLDRVRGEEGTERLVRFPDDTKVIEETIRRLDIGLVIVDSLMSTLGGGDTHRDSDVRSALLPIADLADRMQTTVIAIRHHTKASGGSALTKGVGSIAFTALARAVLTIGRSPEDEALRVMALAKCNLTGQTPSIGFRLVPNEHDQMVVEWTGVVQTSADELVQVPAPEERASVDEACDFLRQLLEEGPVEVGEIRSAARRAAVAWRTVERAKIKLKVFSAKSTTPNGGWRWSIKPYTANEDRQAP